MRNCLRLIFLLITIIAYSCEENENSNKGSLETRDSMLTAFFNMVDTLPYYDTNNLDYRFLKAYRQNDTKTSISIINYLQNTSVKPWMNSYIKPCARNTQFDTLKVEEAYSFFYQSWFCEYYTIATITGNDNNIKATVVVYKNASLTDSLPCTIAEQNAVVINSRAWEKFKEAILVSDFWGLKENSDQDLLDGSSLEVLGYKNNYTSMRGISERRGSVSRSSRAMERLTDPYLMLLKFCNINTGCLLPGKE